MTVAVTQLYFAVKGFVACLTANRFTVLSRLLTPSKLLVSRYVAPRMTTSRRTVLVQVADSLFWIFFTSPLKKILFLY